MSHFSLFSCSVATLSCRIYVVFCQCLRRLLQYFYWITPVLLIGLLQYFYWITPVLLIGLLQYLHWITAVLLLDYSSTSIGLLQYFYPNP